MSAIGLTIGIGGIMGNELMTFDFTSGEKLKPYVCKILGRDFQYGFKREFIDRKYTSMKKNFYGKEMVLITFALERNIVYEYMRFAGKSLGEIHEGYFVILSDRVVELDKDEVIHYIGTRKEKEKPKTEGKAHFQPNLPFAPDDIDF